MGVRVRRVEVRDSGEERDGLLVGSQQRKQRAPYIKGGRSTGSGGRVRSVHPATVAAQSPRRMTGVSADLEARSEAQLHPDNPLIEARVMVGKPVAAGMRSNERLIHWATSQAHRPLSTEMVQTPDGWVLACGGPSTSGG
ncbi:hypothetical protein GCM10010228_57920 [Streptomyces massasporeus]|nr:hypothetical protein GCM10010228_57920 [Streptomyces massasporeus]